jgi:hypothetical protein
MRMRIAVIATAVFLNACASDKLSLAPPPGVDFSGHWKLNQAESDDPLHLIQAANAQAAVGPGDGGNSGSRSGRGGGAGGAPGPHFPAAPMIPSLGALSAAVHWPGKQLEIKQVGGVVAFSSDGENRVCQPTDAEKKRPPRHDASDRDAPLPAGRDAPPPVCRWSDKTLVIHTIDLDEGRAPFQERYSLSEDGHRLVEEVSFTGGRSNGFVLSRVWDRLP